MVVWMSIKVRNEVENSYKDEFERERVTLRKMKFGIGAMRFDFVHNEEET